MAARFQRLNGTRLLWRHLRLTSSSQTDAWFRVTSESPNSKSMLRGAAAAVLTAVAGTATIQADSKRQNSHHADDNNCNGFEECPVKQARQEQSPALLQLPSISIPSILSRTTTKPQYRSLVSRCYCDARSLVADRKGSRLRRTATMLQYDHEVSIESVRSRYKVDWKHPIGEGGFGAVYRATDRKTGQEVALKRISKKFTNDLNFQREMEAFLHLRKMGGHPNICGMHENFDEGQYFYFSLDLISGGEMFDHLIRSGPYSEEHAARLIREVASALAFMHGIGFVHGDLKPENLMLSTEKTSDAVIKVIDFGCAQVTANEDEQPGVVGLTAAYSSPEMLKLPAKQRKRIDPPLDIWSLGIILHIMLAGFHPFDLSGDGTDAQISGLVTSNKPIESLEEGSDLTDHLSDSAVDLMRKMLERDPSKRITAAEMLQHPWVRGESAKKDTIEGSDTRLSKFRAFKSRLEAKVFEDIIAWSEDENIEDASKRTSLIERAFKTLDAENKGFITAKDLKKFTGGAGMELDPNASSSADEGMSLSAFSTMLSENMKDKYFPKGEVVYKEGEEGNSMLFINSGMLEVNTKEGYSIQVKAGNFIGEGALISPHRTRNATVKCLTPVHAIEISREYFDKYLAASETGLALYMREKDKKRALQRTKNMLQRQHQLKPMDLKCGDFIFQEDLEADEMFFVEEGDVDFIRNNRKILTSKPGEMIGVGALVTHRKRNSSALCASRTGCRVHALSKSAFFDFIQQSPILKESATDVFLRREFEKAVAYKTEKHFPMTKKELRKVFDIIDEKGDGILTYDELRSLILNMDKDTPDEVVRGILNSLDIDMSGKVDFDEFCHIFSMKARTQKVH